MGKEKKNTGTGEAFEAGTCAFAKVRGYPAWPAKVVEQRHDGKYAVIFFGTLETANVQPTDIWPYDTPNTTKFCTDKNLKRPFFMEGMEQMKQALAEEGGRAADSLEQEEADMVKVGRSKSKEAADDSQGSSKGLKRKLMRAEHKEDLIKRLEVKFAKRMEDQMRALKKEMRAEMTFMEDKLRAEITLVEDAMRSEMEQEINAVKKSLVVHQKKWKK